MMIFKKGDIVLVPFPFTDGKGYAKRPAMIINHEGHTKTKGHKCVCLMITSQEESTGIERYEHLINAPLTKGLLLEPSWIIVDRVFSTDPKFILRKLGNIGSDIDIVQYMFEGIYC